MISQTVFYARLAVCQTCEFYRGACLKGHVLQGSLGCPLRKFEGVDAVGYMEDKPMPPEMPAPGCCGGPKSEELKPLTWSEVWRHLMSSVQEWQKAGFPMVRDEAYSARIAACKSCAKGQYQWFQCKHCRCVVYTKAKLATETCPYGLWPSGS